MPNLYGVANPNPPVGFAQNIGGTDIVVPFGTETNFISIAPTATVSPGVYYPAAWGVVVVSLGATPPGAINWSLRINSGADIAQQFTASQVLVANANLMVPVFLYGYGTVISNPSPATLVQVSATCNVANVTVRVTGTQFTVTWLRAPDQ